VGFADLGFTNLVTNEAYAIAFTAYDTYTITVTAASSLRADKPTSPAVVTLNQDGTWTP
jgi:hypothetical protein